MGLRVTSHDIDLKQCHKPNTEILIKLDANKLMIAYNLLRAAYENEYKKHNLIINKSLGTPLYENIT